MNKKNKLVACKHCNQEIAASAKKCPHCGGKNAKPFFKKWWFWLLLIIIIIGISTSNSDDSNTSESPASTSVSETNTQSPSEANTESNTKSNTETSKPALDVQNAANTKITIDEQIIFDAEGIVITAKEYVDDAIWGEGIKLLIENTTESDVGISCDALIVNDYMIYDFFSEVIAAGKKANETLYLSSSALKAAGISNVGKIEILFYLYDADTYSRIHTAECVTIETSEFSNMDASSDIEGVEIMNVNDIKIIAKAVNEHSFWGSTVVLYIENNSGNHVIISCDDCSINGFMVTPLFYSTVHSGKKAVDTIDFLTSVHLAHGWWTPVFQIFYMFLEQLH